MDKTMDLLIERLGIQVVEKDFICEHGKFDVIGIGPDDELCFIIKRVRKLDDDFASPTLSDEKRLKLEHICEKYLTTITDPDLLNRQVLFCFAELKVVGDNRGFFRFSKLS